MELEPEEGDEDSDPGEDDDAGEDDDPAEPSLGSIGAAQYADRERWAFGGRKDLEDEHDGAEPDECGEPSLGSFDRMTNRERSWSTKIDGWFVGHDREQAVS
jgi:hypothetical protein